MTQYIIVIFPLAVSIAGILDFFFLTIPNGIPLTLLTGFLIAILVSDLFTPLLFSHLFAGGAALLIGFAMFARGWIGGGDGKLLAAAALWLGLDHLLPFLFWTAALGGLLSLVLLAYRRLLPPVWLLGQSWAMRLHDSREGIPYGIAIAGAGLIVCPQTIWMTGIAN